MYIQYRNKKLTDVSLLKKLLLNDNSKYNVRVYTTVEKKKKGLKLNI